ncbi:MAG: phosphoenolpyruvate kinase, partial [Chitinophagaceae bacterium]
MDTTTTQSTSINSTRREQLFGALRTANLAFQKTYPGDRSERQPVHTVYGGANLFKSDLARAMGERALETFQTYAPDAATFGTVFGLKSGKLAEEVYKKVLRKLQTEAVEDFRIDFEDGYGNRANEEEDATAVQAALEAAKGIDAGTLPPFIGIRIKPFTEEMKERGLRTLDLFVSTLVKASGGRLPDNFVVMLPKVTIPEQPATLAAFFDILESELGLTAGSLKMEMMVETTQSIMAADGTNPLWRFVQAAKGRCIAMHFGTYDYTASAGITARYQ